MSPVNGYLAASVDAVSLAFFSCQSDGPRAPPRLAREKYSDALTLLNRALLSPSCVMSNSTLLSVLLLDLFEKIAARSPGGTDTWMSHMNGALALVKLRDIRHFQDPISLRLAVRLSTNLLLSCLASDAPVPSALIRLRAEIEPFLNKDDPKWQITGIVIKYANLRRSMQEGHLSESDIIRRSTELDAEFAAFASAMPPSWMYETVSLQRTSARVFGEHYDTYKDHLIAQCWNVLRVMRIFLNDIIRSVVTQTPILYCGNDVDSTSSDEPTRTIDTLAKSICAAVPQFTTCMDVSQQSADDSAVQGMRCYALIFPLYVAGLYASPQTNIRPWIVQELRFMVKKVGIRTVDLVADMLEREDGTNPWAVYAILGSYACAA